MKRLFSLATLLCATALFGDNLLTNGGFESGIWTFDKVGVWELSTDSVEGGYSLRTTSSTTKRECASGSFPVNPYVTYRLSGWIKTDSVDLMDGVEIRVLQCNSANQAIGWLDFGPVIATGRHRGWMRYEHTISNLHVQCASVKLYLKLKQDSGGEVLFDDIQFKPVAENSNFDFDQSAWSYETGGGGWSYNTTDPHYGVGCMSSNSNPDATRYSATSLIPVVPLQKYSLSAFIKTSGVVASDGVEIRILQCNSSNQAISWYSPPGTWTGRVFSQGGTSSDYTGHFMEGMIFHPDTANVKIYVRHLKDAGGTAFVDDIQLIAEHRDNFDWGVCGHAPMLSAAYKTSNLEECMTLAGNMGANLYRVDFTLVKDGSGQINWTWSDAVVNEAYTQGRKVYAVLYCIHSQSTQEIYNDAYAFAERYKGKIDYYQLLNEVDCGVILGAQYDGTSTSHYDMTDYAIAEGKLDAISNGVHDADPDAKRVINITWKHYGFLELLANGGVEWDVSGLDWYWGVTSHLTETINALLALDKEIIISESNIDGGTYTNTEQESADEIVDQAEFFYYHSSPLIIGYIPYELLDQTLHPTPAQSSYGLYNSDGNGTIGSSKAAGIAYGNFISDRQ